MPYSFSKIIPSDLLAIADILNYYVTNSTVTFHKALLSAEDMKEKVFFDKPYYQAYLIRDDNDIIGYCALSMWKKQEAYRNTAEINIYLRHDYTGKGIGTLALQHLETFARKNDMHTLIAGLTGENVPSKKLFEKNGFKLCATFHEVGHKFDRVLDVI